jgi:hypothetical protein
MKKFKGLIRRAFGSSLIVLNTLLLVTLPTVSHSQSNPVAKEISWNTTAYELGLGRKTDTVSKSVASNPKNSNSNADSSNSTLNEKVAGNFKIKLLECKASEDRVQCDISISNLTSIDRTLYVASKQHGGIRLVALAELGVTTMIDANGASYVADTISFANKHGDETGQSYFTVYSNTHPTLKVTFTGVENSATVQRLDLVIGEYKKSENFVAAYKIRYSVNPDGSFTVVPNSDDTPEKQPPPNNSIPSPKICLPFVGCL